MKEVFDFLTGKQVTFLLLASAVLTGLGLALYLIYMAIFRARFRGRASGEITGVDAETTRFFSRDALRYRLRVRFDMGSGVMESLEAQGVVKPGDFYVGQQVNVRYRTDKPDLFLVEENDSAAYALKVLGVMLAIELVMAALVAVVSRNLGV